MGSRALQALLLSLALLSYSVFAQEERGSGGNRLVTVETEEELRVALEDDSVFRISIDANMSLSVSNGWDRDNPVVLNRSKVLTGRPDRSVKISIRDLILPGPRFDFLKVDRPVNITFVRLAISGFPFAPGPTEFWNVSVFFEECLLEIWDTNGISTDWAVIISRPRPEGFVRDEAESTTQNVGATTKGFCDRNFPFSCPQTETYLLLIDMAFSWNASRAVLPGDEPQVVPGVFSARQTLMAVPIVDIFPVDSPLSAGQALRSTGRDGEADKKLLIVENKLELTKTGVPCSQSQPIFMTKSFEVLGSQPAVPPLDLIDFNFTLQCVTLPRGLTATFSNLIFNNTVVSVPQLSQIVPWQTMVPFIKGKEGSEIVLENIVWNVFYVANAPLTAEDILADISNRTRAYGQNLQQVAELKTDAFCSDFVENSSRCLETQQCSELSRCRNGAVLVDDVAFSMGGVDIKILNSLLIPREASEFSLSSRDGEEPVGVGNGGDAIERNVSIAENMNEAMNMTDASNNSETSGVRGSRRNGRGRGADDAENRSRRNATAANMTSDMGRTSISSTTIANIDDVNQFNSSSINGTVALDDDEQSKTPVTVIIILVGLAVLGVIIAAIALGLWRYQKRRQQNEDGDINGYENELAFTVQSSRKTHLQDAMMDPHGIFTDVDSGVGALTEVLLKEQQLIAEKLFKNIEMGELLGRGSYGSVYKAMWNGAVVAVKVLAHTPEDKMEENIEREVQLMTELKHPNIVQQYQSATRVVRTKPPKIPRSSSASGVSASGSSSMGTGRRTDDTSMQPENVPIDRKETWMVMEFCDVGILTSAIKTGWFFMDEERTQLNMDWILRTAQDIARGFQYLHENSIVHGDLKPHNILLATSVWDERRWVAKVADFGVSRRIGAASHVYTNTVGTMAYLAPEIMRDYKLSDKADVYAFSMIMWQLISGTSVFQNVTPADVWRMVAVEGWRPTFPPGVDPRYQALAVRCWFEEPHERPSFNEIQSALDGMLQSL